MPYVARAANGAIAAVFPREAPDAREHLAANAPELETFLQSRLDAMAAPREHLEATDHDMARLLEDLVDVLLGKGVLAWQDFAPQAQRKLLFRKDLRWHLQRRAADDAKRL